MLSKELKAALIVFLYTSSVCMAVHAVIEIADYWNEAIHCDCWPEISA